VLSTPFMIGNTDAISMEDISSLDCIEYLASNKRNFGKLLDEVQEVPAKHKYRPKLTDIKINPQQTIIEGLQGAESRKSFHSVKNTFSTDKLEFSSLGTLRTQNQGLSPDSKKLPPITIANTIAAKAKEAANYFFVTQNLIKSNSIKKKKTRAYMINIL
jgi:hypothetical protein